MATITNDCITTALDLDSSAYIEIKVYSADDFYAYLNYVADNHVVLVSVDWLRTILCVKNNMGNNTRRIYLFPQGQVL